MTEGDFVPSNERMQQSTRDEIVLRHLQAVRMLARTIHRNLPMQVELDDLISAGTVGLIEAASRYKEGYDTQFLTFVHYRVRGAIFDFLRDTDWAGRTLRKRDRQIAVARAELTVRIGREPNEAEIASKIGIDLTVYRQITRYLNHVNVCSLDGENALEDLPQSHQDACRNDALLQLLSAESTHQIDDAIRSLPEREHTVITLRYFEELSLEHIAILLDVAPSRASQLCAAAHKKIKLYLRKVNSRCIADAGYIKKPRSVLRGRRMTKQFR